MAGLLTEAGAAVKPYYDDGQVTLYLGDCLEVLPSLRDVGLVLTSPPYNLSGDGNKPTGTYFRNLANGYDVHGDDMPHEMYVQWQHEVIEKCWSALSPDGAIFYNHKPIVRGNEIRTPLALVPSGVPVRQVIIWDRGSGFNRQFTYFVPAHEWILLLAKPDFRLTTRSVDDVWRIPFETNTEHPAPFPLRLARRAVEATKAALVLDPFAGSGTTLRAAKDAGRKAVGIEINERYCELAARRMSQESFDFGEAS